MTVTQARSEAADGRSPVTRRGTRWRAPAITC